MEDELTKCKNYILKLLSYKPYTAQQIREKVIEKNYQEAVYEVAIEDLERVGLIDDLKFAEMWIRSRMRNKPKGKWLLKRELKEKGVSEKDIRKALAEFDETYDQRKIAKKLAEKRLRRYRNIEKQKARNRIYGFLRRRGFSYDMIKSVMDELWTEDF